jgi:hypothetical protein
MLFGVIGDSILERSFFRTGIEVGQVLLGTSDLAQLLKATLQRGVADAAIGNRRRESK